MRGWFALRRLAGAAAWLLAMGAGAHAFGEVAPLPLEAMPVVGDPTVAMGTLPNGVRYLVRRAARPSGSVSLRLGLRVGSYEERDDERGFAHFIEHMAFRSPRDFPDNAVDGAFAGKGVAFGRDLNAGTDLATTTFRLDLPAPTSADLDLGFRWLRDVADGIVFDEAAIGRERGVVLAEKRERDSPQVRAEEAVLRFQAPDARTTQRSPIGLEATLAKADAASLQAFYRRWYRPENAVVVVVGDLPLDQLERRVKAAFQSWRGSGPAEQRPVAPSLDRPRALEAFVFDGQALMDEITACRISRSRGEVPDTLARVRAEALDRLVDVLADGRLSALRTDPAAEVISAGLKVDDNMLDLRQTCLIILPRPHSEIAALKSAAAELRRLGADGPTESELRTAVDDVRSHLRGAIDQSPALGADDMATTLLDNALAGHVTPDPREALREFDVAMEGLTVGEVKTAFAADWSSATPLLSSTSSSGPTAGALQAAWREALAAPPLPTYVDRAAISWPYDFGKVGSVATRTPVATGDYVRIVFQNGVVLKFKRTDFAKQEVKLVVRFGAGRGEIDGPDYFPSMIAAASFSFGGLGKVSFEDLERIFQSKAHHFQLTIGDDAFLLNGDAFTTNLGDYLNVFAAYVSDPGFRASADPVLHAEIDVLYRLLDSSPNLALSNGLAAATPNGTVLSLPPRGALEVDHKRAEALLRASVTRDPLEITLVGDLDEATAIALVGSSFGALPGRTPPTVKAHPVFLRFPETPLGPLRLTYGGPPEKGGAAAVWPLYVAEPARRREEYGIVLLGSVFDDALRRRVRVELGKTYAPSVETHTPDDADQGMLTVMIESRPEDLARMQGETLDVARRLAQGEITQAQLDAARAPRLATAKRELITNAGWAQALSSHGAGEDQGVIDLLDAAPLLASISLAEVKASAARWLSRAPILVVIEPKPVGTKP